MNTCSGFCDLQVNGFVGVDYTEENLTGEAFRESAYELLKRGTILFVPTIITSFEESLTRNLKVISKVLDSDPVLARHIPGFHLEGPYISSEPGAVGAHNPKAVRPPSCEELDRLQECCGQRIRIITVAAEVPGLDKFIPYAVSKRIVISCGHQLASAEDLERAALAGAQCVTHFGNGVPNMMPRHENPVVNGLGETRLKLMFIPDGHHLPLNFLKMLLKVVPISRLIAVTDAASAAGLPPGRYRVLGNDAVLEPNGRLHNPVGNHLVGSSATMVECMNVLNNLALIGYEDILKLGLHNPLALLGMTVEDLPEALSTVTWTHDEGFKVESL